jgi:hypothetical protein
MAISNSKLLVYHRVMIFTVTSQPFLRTTYESSHSRRHVPPVSFFHDWESCLRYALLSSVSFFIKYTFQPGSDD